MGRENLDFPCKKGRLALPAEPPARVPGFKPVKLLGGRTAVNPYWSSCEETSDDVLRAEVLYEEQLNCGKLP